MDKKKKSVEEAVEVALSWRERINKMMTDRRYIAEEAVEGQIEAAEKYVRDYLVLDNLKKEK